MFRSGDEPIPGYRLEKLLGCGGCGEVWKASAPGRTFTALKLINLGARGGLRELRGLQHVKNLRHGCLLPIYAIWILDYNERILAEDELEKLWDSTAQAPGEAIQDLNQSIPALLVVSMMLGEGNLFDRMQECQQAGYAGIPRDELLGYIEDAARGLDFLNAKRHDFGAGPIAIQHCDIKPQNIMLVGGMAMVCDFGLARVLSSSRGTSQMPGSPAYIAPECIAGSQPSFTTDQYSLAVSYVELRTGALPFADDSISAVFDAHLEGRLNLSQLPAGERDVIRRATSVRPGDRFPTTMDMVRALRDATRTPRECVNSTAILDHSITQSGSAVHEQMVSSPPVALPIVDTPSISEPTVNQPTLPEPAAVEPAAVEAAANEPAANESTINEPAMKAPAVSEQAAVESSGISSCALDRPGTVPNLFDTEVIAPPVIASPVITPLMTETPIAEPSVSVPRLVAPPVVLPTILPPPVIIHREEEATDIVTPMLVPLVEESRHAQGTPPCDQISSTANTVPLRDRESVGVLSHTSQIAAAIAILVLAVSPKPDFARLVRSSGSTADSVSVQRSTTTPSSDSTRLNGSDTAPKQAPPALNSPALTSSSTSIPTPITATPSTAVQAPSASETSVSPLSNSVRALEAFLHRAMVQLDRATPPALPSAASDTSHNGTSQADSTTIDTTPAHKTDTDSRSVEGPTEESTKEVAAPVVSPLTNTTPSDLSPSTSAPQPQPIADSPSPPVVANSQPAPGNQVNRSDNSVSSSSDATLSSSVKPLPPEHFDNSVGMRLQLIPAGEFLMGSDESADQLKDAGIFADDKVTNESPRHLVKITKPFYLGVYEVTRKQFASFVEETGYRTDAERNGKGAKGFDLVEKNLKFDTKYHWRNPGWMQASDHPVVNVSWNDAVAFCNWLSRTEGRTECYSIEGTRVVEVYGDGYRLPREAEWEYACRADTRTRYVSGDHPNSLAGFGNVRDASYERAASAGESSQSFFTFDDRWAFTSRCGEFKPNRWGLYDMTGNVMEWCQDWFYEYPHGIVTDPKGPMAGTARAIRGGAWRCGGASCFRTANRESSEPDFASCLVGFRVVLSQPRELTSP